MVYDGTPRSPATTLVAQPATTNELLYHITQIQTQGTELAATSSTRSSFQQNRYIEGHTRLTEAVGQHQAKSGSPSSRNHYTVHSGRLNSNSFSLWATYITDAFTSSNFNCFLVEQRTKELLQKALEIGGFSVNLSKSDSEAARRPHKPAELVLSHSGTRPQPTADSVVPAVPPQKESPNVSTYSILGSSWKPWTMASRSATAVPSPKPCPTLETSRQTTKPQTDTLTTSSGNVIEAVATTAYQPHQTAPTKLATGNANPRVKLTAVQSPAQCPSPQDEQDDNHLQVERSTTRFSDTTSSGVPATIALQQRASQVSFGDKDKLLQLVEQM